MTSKEALEKLCKVKIYQKEASAYDYLGKEIYKEEINLIKQALERLEVLEKEYKEYKEVTNQVIKAFQTSNRNLAQENEKLKKVIALLNLLFNFEVDAETETIYCCLGDVSVNGANLIEDFELLKEVLE